MLGYRIRPVICVLLGLLPLGVLQMAGPANAGFNDAGETSAAASAGCAVSASLRRAPLATASPTTVARASTLSAYDDYVEDVQTAPDICGSNLVTNDNIGAITIAVHIHDRSAFSAGDGYKILLDTDSNATTGGAESGVAAGAEYVIDVVDDTSSLRAWNGTSFDLVTPQHAIFSGWIDGLGPAVQIMRADLGEAQSFNFILITSNGLDLDLAPDTGAWSYTLTPLELDAGALRFVPARAGKPFVAGMEVVRSDFEIPLEEGNIKCAARLGGKRLAGRGAFAGERVICVWNVPKNARGKRLRGSVAVTFQDVTAMRPFNVRVN